MAPNNFRPRRLRHPDSKTARFLQAAAAGTGILLALWSFEIAGGATQPAVREGVEHQKIAGEIERLIQARPGNKTGAYKRGSTAATN